MSSKIDFAKIPKIKSGYRLQHEETQQAWVLLYPEGMVKLNESAAEILKRCNGERDITQIVAQLETDFEQTGLSDDVVAFMEIAIEQKWISLSDN